MAKLFPPLIEGTLPAFYSEGDGAVKITVPFSLNRSVSQFQIKGLSLKIKTVQSSSYLYTQMQTNKNYFELEDSPWVEFTIKDVDKKMKVGQFYKLQIAFIDENNEIGYYSSVGVAKYTTKPKVYINDFDSKLINMNTKKFIGTYSQSGGDTTERVYSYRFDVYNNLNEKIYSSGDLLHNTANDVEIDESYDIYELENDLPIDISYRIIYTVTTANNLTISSPKYKIMQKVSIPPEMEATLTANLNYDNGYIVVNLIGSRDNYNIEIPVTGSFLLCRSSEDSNFTKWDEISRFKLIAQFPTRELWKDFTVEQGKQYQYAIQQYNDSGLYSEKILSNMVYCDFEDAFLYDGERQLRIRYNPKVTSFKVNVLESKTDTIGSSHPIITRNSKAYYKEFPISGLITYKIDNDELFLLKDEYNFKGDTTNLTSENIAQEREFKMAVYQWLTNGKIKLFRSPSEGNFIVRLMNVSLSPNDTVGRMLHTFTGTAYEMANFTYDNLNNYGFIYLDNPEVARMCWETVLFTKKDDDGNLVYRTGEQINKHPVYMVRFEDMMPGDKIELYLEDSTTPEIIQIGVTGSYYIDLGVPIRMIILSENTTLTGSMTYAYQSVQSNTFDKIEDVHVIEIPAQQFIGEHDVIKEIAYVQDDNGNWIKNPKVEIVSFLYLSAQRRTQEQLVEGKNNIYYQDREQKIIFDKEKADAFTLFQVGTWQKTQYSPNRFDYTFKPKEDKSYIDFLSDKTYNKFEPYLIINGSEISVEETRDFDLAKPGLYTELRSCNGITLNVAYQLRTVDYKIEKTTIFKDLPTAWNRYQRKLNEYQNLLDQIDTMPDDEYINFDIDLNTYLNEIKELYRKYILLLIEAQDLQKEAEGIEE